MSSDYSHDDPNNLNILITDTKVTTEEDNKNFINSDAKNTESIDIDIPEVTTRRYQNFQQRYSQKRKSIVSSGHKKRNKYKEQHENINSNIETDINNSNQSNGTETKSFPHTYNRYSKDLDITSKNDDSNIQNITTSTETNKYKRFRSRYHKKNDLPKDDNATISDITNTEPHVSLTSKFRIKPRNNRRKLNNELNSNYTTISDKNDETTTTEISVTTEKYSRYRFRHRFTTTKSTTEVSETTSPPTIHPNNSLPPKKLNNIYAHKKHRRGRNKHISTNKQENNDIEVSSTTNKEDLVSTTVATAEFTTKVISSNPNKTVSGTKRLRLRAKFGRRTNLTTNFKHIETTTNSVNTTDEETIESTITSTPNIPLQEKYKQYRKLFDHSRHNQAEQIKVDSNDTFLIKSSGDDIVNKPLQIEEKHINDSKFTHEEINPFQNNVTGTEAPSEEIVTLNNVETTTGGLRLHTENTEVDKRNDSSLEQGLLRSTQEPSLMKSNTDEHVINLEMLEAPKTLEVINSDENSTVSRRKRRESEKFDAVDGAFEGNITEPKDKLIDLFGPTNDTDSEIDYGNDSSKDVSVTGISDSELHSMQDYIDNRTAEEEVTITVVPILNLNENVGGIQTMATNFDTTESVTESYVDTSNYGNVNNQTDVNLSEEETTTDIIHNIKETNETSIDLINETVEETTESDEDDTTYKYEDIGFTVDWSSTSNTEDIPEKVNDTSNIMVLANIKNETDIRKEKNSLVNDTVRDATNIGLLIQAKNNTNYIALKVNASENAANMMLNFTWPSTDDITNRLTLNLMKKSNQYVINSVQLYLVKEGNVTVLTSNVSQPHTIGEAGSLYLDPKDGVKIVFSNGGFFTSSKGNNQTEELSADKKGKRIQVEIIVGTVLLTSLVFLLIFAAYKLFRLRKKQEDMMTAGL
ncbi:uncharacterized protein LOC130893044 [Diorhabda carinulata]|uniref:uncharacterized protein LOC130893044 n=1 Tax=Diorhabda carinulata TaxID=1163345 RepID=UPI0025A1D06F|nr:uncharacterized protein LOC130893044 [Diorhabda carinulata]